MPPFARSAPWRTWMMRMKLVCQSTSSHASGLDSLTRLAQSKRWRFSGRSCQYCRLHRNLLSSGGPLVCKEMLDIYSMSIYFWCKTTVFLIVIDNFLMLEVCHAWPGPGPMQSCRGGLESCCFGRLAAVSWPQHIKPGARGHTTKGHWQPSQRPVEDRVLEAGTGGGYTAGVISP